MNGQIGAAITVAGQVGRETAPANQLFDIGGRLISIARKQGIASQLFQASMNEVTILRR